MQDKRILVSVTVGILALVAFSGIYLSLNPRTPLPQYSIHGIVIDTDGDPIKGCSVGGVTGEEMAVNTDDDGSFTWIRPVPPGSYTAQALCDGGAKGEIELDVPSRAFAEIVVR